MACSKPNCNRAAIVAMLLGTTFLLASWTSFHPSTPRLVPSVDTNERDRPLVDLRVAPLPEATEDFMFMRKTMFGRLPNVSSTSKSDRTNLQGQDAIAVEKPSEMNVVHSAETSRNNSDSKPTPAIPKPAEIDISRQDKADAAPVIERPSCTKGKTRQRLDNLFGEKFNPNLPPFATPESIESQISKNFPLPFGFKGAESIAQTVVSKLPNTGLPDIISSLSCRRCIVVGNGNLMKGSRLGHVIDNYDVVMRLNDAPISGFERDVGAKTTFRLLYPESSLLPGSRYGYAKSNFTLVVLPFKSADVQWADKVVDGRDTSGVRGFWASVAHVVRIAKSNVRLFNPTISYELSSNLIGFSMNGGRMNKNVPTSGVMAIMLAARICDEVSVAGFGYDTSKPKSPLHYYSSASTQVVMNSHTHNIGPERKMLGRLVSQGAINDLTKGIRTY
ncbi:lactosylceramide alpha-2,3-sialyltransferase-like [Diadema antillarum]|uniref:lactosylceramide alpha-2,3-sialyltransferase-like n=1 Tax=Diadema antillarum TaxID=105358 RepID=UPI003A8C2117